MKNRFFAWFISLLVGGCIVIGLGWFMSGLINVETSLQQDRTNETSFYLTSPQRECEEHHLSLFQLISESQACHKDDDCDLVENRRGWMEYGCLIPVQKDKIDVVSSAFSESSFCGRTRYCTFSLMGRHGGAGMAICQNNTCAVEFLPRISAEMLMEQTLESISESLNEEGT